MAPRDRRRDDAVTAVDDRLAAALGAALTAAAGLSEGSVRVRIDGVTADDLPEELELRLDLATPAPADGRPDEDEDDEDEDDEDEDEDDEDEDDESSDRRSARDRAPETSDEVSPAELDAEAEAAADLLEGLLDALDLDGDLQLRVRDGYAEVEIVDAGEGILIGRRGQTLDAIQELVRSALQRRFQRRTHVVVEVDGYRARRIERLLERTDEAIREVRESREGVRLEPMDAFERKVVHQRVAEAGGLTSHSLGSEPGRRVVIEPA